MRIIENTISHKKQLSDLCTGDVFKFDNMYYMITNKLSDDDRWQRQCVALGTGCLVEFFISLEVTAIDSDAISLMIGGLIHENS